MPAYAGGSYPVAGFVCDQQNDQLLLTYELADDKEFAAIKAGRRKNLWDPWSLTVVKDESHIGSLKTARGKCRLSDGIYHIAIKPSPGNVNVQGQCGAWMSASATVTKIGKPVYANEGFEKSCFDLESPVTTRVTIKPGGAAARETTVPQDKWGQ